VAESGLRALLRLAMLEDNRTWLGTCGGCEVVVSRCIVRHDRDEVVNELGMKAIHYLSFQHTANKARLGHAGACKQIPAMILRHASSAAMAEWGCRTAIELSTEDEPNKARLANQGMDEALIHTLVRHGESAVVAEWAFLCVSALALGKETFRIWSKPVGLVLALVKTLRCHRYDAALCALGCAALGSVARDESMGGKFEFADCSEALVEVLKLHVESESVVRQAAAALKLLTASHDGNRLKALAAGVGPLCSSALTKYLTDKDTILLIASVVSNLALNSEIRAGLGEFSLCEALVSVLSLHFQDESVSRVCLQAVGNLCRSEPTNQARVGDREGCLAVVTAMQAHASTNIEVAELGCVTIRYIADLDANKERFSLAGACEVAVAVLEKYIENEAVSVAAVFAISSLVQYHPGNAQRLGAVGACALVVTTMDKYLPNEGLCEAGCRAIDGLASQHDSLEAAGACDAIVLAMLRHGKSETIACWGCRAVCSLSADANNRSKLGVAGACEAVTAALGRHAGVDLMSAMLQWSSGSEAVAQWGCAAIHMLAINHKDHQQRLAAAGACEAVVRALQKYSDNEDIAQAGCRAVVTLARRDVAIQNRMGACGACKAVSLALQCHMSSLPVAEWACRAVGVLAANHEGNTIKLGNAGACDFMSVVMQAHQGSRSVAAGGCGAICSLAGNKHFAFRLGEAGSCEAIVSALKRHSVYEDVAYKGLKAIINLALDPGNAGWLGPTGACEAVLETIRRHSTDSTLVSLGLQAIVNLAEDEGNRARLGVADACVDVVGYLNAMAYNQFVAQHGCRALSKLAIGRDNFARLKSAKASAAIVLVLSRHDNNPQVAEQVCISIRALCEQHHSNRNRLMLAGACGSLVKLLRDYTGSVAVLTQSCAAITALLVNNDIIQNQLCVEGVCRHLVDILGSPGCTDGVMEAVMSAMLALLAEHRPSRIELGDVGACEKLCQILKDKDRENQLGLLSLGMGCLSFLCRDGGQGTTISNRDRVRSQPLIGELLIAILIKNVDMEVMVERSLSVIAGLIPGESISEVLEKIAIAESKNLNAIIRNSERRRSSVDDGNTMDGNDIGSAAVLAGTSDQKVNRGTDGGNGDGDGDNCGGTKAIEIAAQIDGKETEAEDGAEKKALEGEIEDERSPGSRATVGGHGGESQGGEILRGEAVTSEEGNSVAVDKKDANANVIAIEDDPVRTTEATAVAVTDGSEWFSNPSLLRVLVKVLGTYDKNEQIVAYVSRLVTYVCRGNSTNQTFFGSANTCRTLLLILQKYGGDHTKSFACREICFALLELCSQHEGNRIRALGAGAIDILTALNQKSSARNTSPDLGGEIAIDMTGVTALMDLLRAHSPARVNASGISVFIPATASFFGGLTTP